jgi:DNA replication protein DnaC
MNPTFTLADRICSKCGRIVERGMGYEWIEEMCGPCFSRKRYNDEAADRKKLDLDERMKRWEELCPQTYRENDTVVIDQMAFQRVTTYRLQPRGILCMGDSRTGKTTSCWHLLETLYVLHGIDFRAITEVEFAQECSGFNREKAGLLKELINCKILFLDDIGHAQSSRGHLQDLSYVIEKRTQWKKPIIATTQFTPAELVDRAAGSKKTMISILNRLRPHCEVVEFLKMTEPQSELKLSGSK